MRVAHDAWGLFAPPPIETVSEWADAHRYLSAESAAEPGRWSTDRAPYQRGVMDAVSDPRTHTVVWMKSAQVGATEAVNNVLGYFIHRKPGPMLAVQPTVEMARDWATKRLEPMIRDTPALRERVFARRSTKEAGSNILNKAFPGGVCSIGGANSPAGLASRPVGKVLADEVDRWPASAGEEGDPLELARKRTTTFADRKILVVSTPTIAGQSRIEVEFGVSDQRYYFVPCPHCGAFQRLQWAHVQWAEGDPSSAHYVCEVNGCVIEHRAKEGMLLAGEWRPTAEGDPGVAGFHISELYSPWSTWADMATAFLAAKRKGGERLKVWVNTSLGECWDDSEARIESHTVEARAERWDLDKVPAGALVLTAAVDVQDDRLECLVKGWGVDREAWSHDLRIFWGDPHEAELWRRLDEYLLTTWATEDGRSLVIKQAVVDAGHLISQVLRFTGPRTTRRVYAIKGQDTQGAPLVKARPSKIKVPGVGSVPLWQLNPNEGKDVFFANLAVDRHGPRFQHYPQRFDTEFFEQLTSEARKPVYRRGVKTYRYAKTRTRNEALDLEVYNLAALELLAPDLSAREPPQPQPEQQPPDYTSRMRRARRRT